MRNCKCIYMFYILCIGFLFSCGSKDSKTRFFDIPGFFKEEIINIRNRDYTVTKAYSYNREGGKMEVKASGINWEKEFAIFLECDINKPAYFANMEVIRATRAAAETSVLYQSRSKKLSVQIVKITSINGEVSDISIQINKSNLISNTVIDAYYTKGIRYSIIGTQTIKQLGEKNEFWVEGRFYH